MKTALRFCDLVGTLGPVEEGTAIDAGNERSYWAERVELFRRTTMLKGKCLCEGVKIEIDAALGPVIACHCSRCRRATGSAFNPNASVPADKYRIVAGQELVREFIRSPGMYSAFCVQCGSPLYGRSETFPTMWRVRLGTLEDTQGARPIAHIFTGSKADWFEIRDDIEQFEEFPTSDPMRYFKTAD